jgi:hypothetical protein
MDDVTALIQTLKDGLWGMEDDLPCVGNSFIPMFHQSGDTAE